ncbi:MAG: hypothetical protein ACNYPF_03990 [Candidatus Puniceispirillales bacterium WSBS_2018_MAG_OTU23]
MTEQSIEQQKINIEITKAHLGIITDAWINAGRAIIVLCGGAAIALMTQVSAIPQITDAIIYFPIGAIFGVLIFVCGYYSQSSFFQSDSGAEKHRKIRERWRFFGKLSFIIGFSLFIYGCWQVKSTLDNFKANNPSEVGCHQLQQIDDKTYMVDTCTGEVEIFIQ